MNYKEESNIKKRKKDKKKKKLRGGMLTECRNEGYLHIFAE